MARMTVIDGHPSPDRSHFVHALADAYARGQPKEGTRSGASTLRKSTFRSFARSANGCMGQSKRIRGKGKSGWKRCANSVSPGARDKALAVCDLRRCIVDLIRYEKVFGCRPPAGRGDLSQF